MGGGSNQGHVDTTSLFPSKNAANQLSLVLAWTELSRQSAVVQLIEESFLVMSSNLNLVLNQIIYVF